MVSFSLPLISIFSPFLLIIAAQPPSPGFFKHEPSEVAKKSGCINSQLIHSKSIIPYEEIKNSNTIGISSGASAPEILVENFIHNLKNRFTVTINEVEIIKENVIFKVPKKLN